MFLIIGLGNPGEKYKNTWHNLGFLALNELSKKLCLPDFKLSKKFEAETTEGVLNEEKIILAEPQTFMNNSGKSARLLNKIYKTPPENIIIAHDDIDLPFGKIKISKGKSSGGHKGVESIIKSLGTEDFIRVRIGILPEKGKPKNVEDFVLKKINAEAIKEVAANAAEAIEKIVTEGPEKAMNECNK